MSGYTEQHLRLQLMALRQDIAPATDLWPGIAARLQPTATQAAKPRFMARRGISFAMVATLLLALGMAWQLRLPTDTPMIQSQALVMSQDYESALAQYGEFPMHPELEPALADLDHSARTILSGIERYPDARFLLDQLRRTYDRRLELTRRAIITT